MQEFLKQKNMTQTELAKILGCSQGLVSQWCNGLCRPKLETISKLAEVLGVSKEEVMECFLKK